MSARHLLLLVLAVVAGLLVPGSVQARANGSTTAPVAQTGHDDSLRLVAGQLPGVSFSSPHAAKGGVPQGLTEAQFGQLSKTARAGAGHLGDDIAVHGSRAAGTAKPTSDIDIAIRVSPEKFDELIGARFGTPNPGSAKERTMLHAISTGKIQAGEAGLRGLRRELAKEAGVPVDISVVRVGGPFDNGPFIPLR